MTLHDFAALRVVVDPKLVSLVSTDFLSLSVPCREKKIVVERKANLLIVYFSRPVSFATKL